MTQPEHKIPNLEAETIGFEEAEKFGRKLEEEAAAARAEIKRRVKKQAEAAIDLISVDQSITALERNLSEVKQEILAAEGTAKKGLELERDQYEIELEIWSERKRELTGETPRETSETPKETLERSKQQMAAARAKEAAAFTSTEQGWFEREPAQTAVEQPTARPGKTVLQRLQSWGRVGALAIGLLGVFGIGKKTAEEVAPVLEQAAAGYQAFAESTPVVREARVAEEMTKLGVTMGETETKMETAAPTVTDELKQTIETAAKKPLETQYGHTDFANDREIVRHFFRTGPTENVTQKDAMDAFGRMIKFNKEKAKEEAAGREDVARIMGIFNEALKG